MKLSLFSPLAWTASSDFAGCITRATVMCLISVVSIVRGTGAQVDQENWDDDPRTSGWARPQQEFTPRLNMLDSVQLLMAARNFALVWPGGYSFVNIRDGGVNGTIIATSQRTYTPPRYEGPIGFEFAKPVPLMPGQVYAIEPISLNGPNGPFGATLSRYADGRFFGAGQFGDYDLVFREGIGLSVVPEPSPALLLAAGLALVTIRYCLGSDDRRRRLG
jgi:hypothetical protein